MADLIMGIDPGTLVCGYALIKVENRYHIHPYSFGKVKLSQKLALTHRYKQLFTEISTILQQESPKAVVLETQYVHKNPQSTIKLGMARGVLLLAASLQDVPVFEYAPNTAKKAAVGKGNASKKQVQLMVSKLLRVPDLLAEDNEDIADAFALAMCHAHLAPYQDLKKTLV